MGKIKTIEIDTTKGIEIINLDKDEKKRQKGSKQKKKDLDPSDIPQQSKPWQQEPRGIRKALRGGGRAYGQNS